MTSSEQSEADALEQQLLYPEDAEQTDEAPELGLEVNEADAVEQQRVADSPEYDEDYPPEA